MVSLVLRRLSLGAGPLLSSLEVMESLREIWNQVSELLVPGSFMLIFTGKQNLPMGKSAGRGREASSHHLQKNEPLSWHLESTETTEILAQGSLCHV